VLVALLYVPAAVAIRRQGSSISAELFDLATAPDPAALLDRADQRRLRPAAGADPGHRG
jgi:hypothetical protein